MQCIHIFTLVLRKVSKYVHQVYNFVFVTGIISFSKVALAETVMLFLPAACNQKLMSFILHSQVDLNKDVALMKKFGFFQMWKQTTA